jgi:hypothetical protein
VSAQRCAGQARGLRGPVVMLALPPSHSRLPTQPLHMLFTRTHIHRSQAFTAPSHSVHTHPHPSFTALHSPFTHLGDAVVARGQQVGARGPLVAHARQQ